MHLRALAGSAPISYPTLRVLRQALDAVRWQQAHVEFATPQAEALLRSCGLVDLEAVFQCGQRRPCKRSYKEIAYAELGGGAAPVKVFIKRQTRLVRLLPRLPDLCAGNALCTFPRREWNGLHLLRSQGLLAAQPLAYFRTGVLDCRSAIIVRGVPAAISFAEWLKSGAFESLPRDEQQGLVEAVVQTIRRLAVAKLGWRSMETKHFYPEPSGDGWRIWLIDAETVYRRPRRHDLDRDRRKFLRSLAASDAPTWLTKEFAQRLNTSLEYRL